MPGDIVVNPDMSYVMLLVHDDSVELRNVILYDKPIGKAKVGTWSGESLRRWLSSDNFKCVCNLRDVIVEWVQDHAN